jgi:hypothetical protein
MAIPSGPREWSPRKTAMQQFVLDQNIRIESTPVPMNPNIEGEEWADAAYHYRVSLKRGPKSLITLFTMGGADTLPPTPEEVLSSLADDAAGYENNPDFEPWALEYGYEIHEDEDVGLYKGRKTAEKVFKAVEKTSEKLKKFLGEESYKELLWEVERD